jgi:hypothetical protein
MPSILSCPANSIVIHMNSQLFFVRQKHGPNSGPNDREAKAP